MDIIRRNLEWGIKEGLYREDINVDVISKFRLETMMLPFDINIYPQSKYSLPAVIREVIQHFVYGIVSIKGYKMAQKYSQQMKLSIQKN